MCQLTCHVKHSQAEQPRTTMQFRPEGFKWVAQGIYVSEGLHPFHAAFPVVRSLKHRSAANVVVLSELMLLSGSSIERRYPRWRDIGGILSDMHWIGRYPGKCNSTAKCSSIPV